MERLKQYRDFIAYTFFGVCTTVVNLAVYAVTTRFFNLKTVPATVIAWLLAVTFAYVTNRKWVFHSQARGMKAIVKEGLSFFICRIVTGILDIVIMFLCVDVLRMNDLVIKAVSNVIVILANYVASKLIIFRKG